MFVWCCVACVVVYFQKDLPPSAADDMPQTGFWTAFANSVAMIIATEIGDKT